jgi:hypothetical protein
VREESADIFIKERVEIAQRNEKKRDEIWAEHKKKVGLVRPLGKCDADSMAIFVKLQEVKELLNTYNKNKKPSLKKFQPDPALTTLENNVRTIENEYLKCLEHIKLEDEFWDGEERYKFFIYEMC